MKIRYFVDTDTLYVEMNNNSVDETREINEDLLIDLDRSGNLVAITLEHAGGVTDLSEFSLHQILGEPAR